MNSICRLHQNRSYFDYSMLMFSLNRITEKNDLLSLHYLGNSLLEDTLAVVACKLYLDKQFQHIH